MNIRKNDTLIFCICANLYFRFTVRLLSVEQNVLFILVYDARDVPKKIFSETINVIAFNKSLSAYNIDIL